VQSRVQCKCPSLLPPVQGKRSTLETHRPPTVRVPRCLQPTRRACARAAAHRRARGAARRGAGRGSLPLCGAGDGRRPRRGDLERPAAPLDGGRGAGVGREEEGGGRGVWRARGRAPPSDVRAGCAGPSLAPGSPRRPARSMRGAPGRGFRPQTPGPKQPLSPDSQPPAAKHSRSAHRRLARLKPGPPRPRPLSRYASAGSASAPSSRRCLTTTVTL
jgi:hypothetical protein